MRRLSKAQIKQRGALAADLNEARDKLSGEIDSYNDAVTNLFAGVKEAQDDYDTAVEAANEFVSEMRTDMEAYAEDRSEAWQEGEAGEEYQSWLDEWSQDLDACDVEEPADLEAGDCEGGDALESLPEGPGQ